MKKIFLILLTMFSCFCCFAERECNDIPQEYKETKVFKWSKEKHGVEYFKKDNWEWKLQPGTTFANPLRICHTHDSPCIVIGYTCVHGDILNSRKTEIERVTIRYRGSGRFVLQFETKYMDKFYTLLCETANEDPDVFFGNLKKKMGNNMKWFYTSGSGDDKVPYYEIIFED